MRISDWSSDVCSSDLRRRLRRPDPVAERRHLHQDEADDRPTHLRGGVARRPGVQEAAAEAAAGLRLAPRRSWLAPAHAALCSFLPRHGGPERGGLAYSVDRLLGYLPGVSSEERRVGEEC